MYISRFDVNPIIRPHMDDRMGSNINGPSLIRVPPWLPDPLGRYYLYFAHHQGAYIRLAYADRLEGPWQTYAPGTLPLSDSYCQHHVASPDVHVDDERQEIRMYYHGPYQGEQVSRLAISTDGLRFTALPEVLGVSYFRVFRWRDDFYALGMPGLFYRSPDGRSGFQQGPTLFTPDMRHSAVRVDGDTLSVFYSSVHDCPERILLSTIELKADWMAWQASEPVTVLAPEKEYEGIDLPCQPSVRGWAPQRVRQLRDPALYEEADRLYLLYSVAGEAGIAIGALQRNTPRER